MKYYVILKQIINNIINKNDQSTGEDRKDYYKAGKDNDFEIKDINNDNFNDILTGIIHKLRAKDDKDLATKAKDILDKWYGDKTWLKEIRTNEEVIKSIEFVEKLALRNLEDTNSMILNMHLYKIEELKSNMHKIKSSFSSAKEENILFLNKYLEKVDSVSLSDLIPEDGKIPWQYIGLFIFNIKYFEKLDEETKYYIATYKYEDKDNKIKKLLNDKYPNLISLYSFGIDSIIVIAKQIAIDKEDSELTLNHISIAYSLIGLNLKDENINDDYKHLLMLFHILKINKYSSKTDATYEVGKFINLKLYNSLKVNEEVDKFLNFLKKGNKIAGQIFTFNDNKNDFEISTEELIKELEKKYLLNVIEFIKEHKEIYEEIVGAKKYEDKKDFVKKYFEEVIEKSIDENNYFIKNYYSEDLYYECLSDRDVIPDEFKDEEYNKRVKNKEEEEKQKQSKNGTIETLLYIAKGIAIDKKSENIEMLHIKEGLKYLFVNPKHKNTKIVKFIDIIKDLDAKKSELTADKLLEKAYSYEGIKSFDNTTQVFKTLFEKYLENKEDEIFTYKKPDETNEIEKDDEYYTILKKFAKELYDEKLYNDAYEYYDIYLEEKKDDPESLLYTLNCLKNKEKYEEIRVEYGKVILKLKEKLKQPDFISKEIKEDGEKKYILLCLDRLTTAYKEEWKKDKESNKLEKSIGIFNEMIEASIEGIEEIEQLNFYVLLITKLIWSYEQLNKDEKIEELKTTNEKNSDKLINKFDLDKYGEKINEIFEDYNLNDKDEELKRKAELFKEYYIIPYNEKRIENDVIDGKYTALLIYAKYVAIDKEASSITKEHFKEALQYLIPLKEAKTILDKFKIYIDGVKIVLKEKWIIETIRAEKINYDDDVKVIVSEFKQNSDTKYFDFNSINSNSEQTQNVTSYKSGNDILQLAKYLAIESKNDKISVDNLYKAIGCFHINNEKLNELLEGIEIDIVIEDGIGKKIEELPNEKRYPDQELKDNKVFIWLKDHKETQVGDLRDDSSI